MNFLFPRVFPRTPQQRQIELERRLIRGEAQIGGKLFGPVPKGHSRQFFCLDEHTWIWHEEWVVKGRRHAVTTRYRARPNGVVKIQNGRTTRLSVQEARHLYKAIELYQQKVHADYELKMQMV